MELVNRLREKHVCCQIQWLLEVGRRLISKPENYRCTLSPPLTHFPYDSEKDGDIAKGRA